MDEPAASALRHSRTIFASFLRVLVFVGFAKVVGATKEVFIAHEYGTNPVVDTYAYLFTLANWPVAIVSMCGGLIVVPLLVELETADPVRREATFRTLLAWALVASIVVAAVFIGVLQLDATLMPGEGLSPRDRGAMVVSIAGMIPLGVVCVLLSARLMSGHSFLNTAFEALPSLAIIVGLILFADSLDAAWILGGGTLIGFAAYLLALVLVQVPPRRELVPGFVSNQSLVGRIGWDILIVLIAQIAFSFGGGVVDQLAAANLSAQSNSILGYANRLIMLITSLGAIAVGRATLPVFSRAAIDGPNTVRRLTLIWAGVLFGAGAVGGVICHLGAPIGIPLLLLHGQFTVDDLVRVIATFRAGLWQLPFYFASLIIAQAVASRRRYGALLAVNLAALAAKLGVMYLIIGRLGVLGIMYATAIMYALSFGLLLLVMVSSHARRKGEA